MFPLLTLGIQLPVWITISKTKNLYAKLLSRENYLAFKKAKIKCNKINKKLIYLKYIEEICLKYLKIYFMEVGDK